MMAIAADSELVNASHPLLGHSFCVELHSAA
jgi:hypothetical protein